MPGKISKIFVISVSSSKESRDPSAYQQVIWQAKVQKEIGETGCYKETTCHSLELIYRHNITSVIAVFLPIRAKKLMVLKKDILYAWQDDQHDHKACVASATSKAQEICLKKGARLTPIRQRVLELVWGSHKPVGAYEILDEIKSEHKSSAPPTVYRALDFLMEHGFAFHQPVTAS